MLHDRLLRRLPCSIGAVVIQHLRLHRGQEGFGKLRQVAVGSPQGAAPKNKISNERQQHQEKREQSRVPQREPHAHRIKHGGSFWLSDCLCRDSASGLPFLALRSSPIPRPRRKSIQLLVECATAAYSRPNQFFAAGGLRTLRSGSKTGRSSRPTRAPQFPRAQPPAPRCAPQTPAINTLL